MFTSIKKVFAGVFLPDEYAWDTMPLEEFKQTCVELAKQADEATLLVIQAEYERKERDQIWCDAVDTELAFRHAMNTPAS